MLPLLLALVAAGPELEDSVVRLQVYSARYDWQAPWRVLPVEASSGTGFLIAGGRIVTNAHVVRDARQVVVKRFQKADPFIARIKAIGDDCDLAVLEVEDPAFHKGLKPLEIATSVPDPRTEVVTYGYPAGGQELSSTTGIVSRIEWRTYVHSEADGHVAVQTDAAINPGNSGGPVIQKGKVVGVAFQGASSLQSVGYFIPVPVLHHFLKDLEDGKYDGFPDSGLRTTDLLSPAYKRERGLPPGKAGVVVDAVSPSATFDGAVKPGDVVLSVEGQAIDDDGSIPLGKARVPFHHAVDMKQVGEKVKIGVWRDGKPLDLEAPVRRLARYERMRASYNKPPKYVVYAGLVFMVLERELLRTFGEDWYATIPRDMAWYHFFREWEDPAHADDDVVVLARVLQHPVNSQLATSTAVVLAMDGKPVTSLAEVARAIDEAKGEYLELRLGKGYVEALNRKEAEAAHPLILKTYGISKDRNL